VLVLLLVDDDDELPVLLDVLLESTLDAGVLATTLAAGVEETTADAPVPDLAAADTLLPIP